MQTCPRAAQLGEQRWGVCMFVNIRELRGKEGKESLQLQATASRRPKGTLMKIWDGHLKDIFLNSDLNFSGQRGQ